MVEVLFLQESKKKDAKGSDSLCNNWYSKANFFENLLFKKLVVIVRLF
jgi:hypothetical protein